MRRAMLSVMTAPDTENEALPALEPVGAMVARRRRESDPEFHDPPDQ